MTSYKQFSYYEGDLTFQVTTNNEKGIFAFIIYNSNVSLSQLTYPDNIVGDLIREEGAGEDSRYNLLFRYNPGATTFNKKWFFHTDGTHLDNNLVVDWVSNTDIGTINVDEKVSTSDPNPLVSAFTNSYPYNWNRERMVRASGSGGGDPHIRPYFNKTNDIYLLPSDNLIYKYFDNQDPSERIVINTQMQILSLDRIIFAEELMIRRQGRNNWDKVPNAIKNIIKYPKTIETKTFFDPCFAKYISIIYQSDSHKEQLLINVENLKVIKKWSKTKEKINVSKIQKSDGRLYKNKKGDIKNTKMRTITITSKKLDTIKIVIYRDYERLNHRNHIALVFTNHSQTYLKRCAGVLMNINTHGMSVPSLNYIDRINYSHSTNNNLATKDAYLTKWKGDLRKHRFKIRNMIRAEDFRLLFRNNREIEELLKDKKSEIISSITDKYKREKNNVPQTKLVKIA